MKIGFGLPVSGSWAQPPNVLRVAGRAEELGYSSLWSFQRLLAPVRADLAPVYRSVLDPTVALAYAAAVTERIELGIAIINAPFESPALLAKQLATLDVLSGGRVAAGLGLGWLEEEFTASGMPFARRGRRMEEYRRCLAALWGPDPVRFDGEFYQVPESEVLPKPVQQPHPPILMGGDAPTALQRVGRIADGWISSSRVPPAELGRRVEAVKAAAEAAGRDPESLRFVCRGVLLDGPRTRPLTGTLEQIHADLPEIAGQGITELFIDLNFIPAIGSPDVDPQQAMHRAEMMLEEFAPGAK
jgi:probable F420-dependent oxidoreductase